MSVQGTELDSGQKLRRGKLVVGRNRGLQSLEIRSSWGARKWSRMKIHIIVALALFWSSPAHANTIAAASCSQTDVQNAVNSASTGDTVQVPGPCTAAWSSQVSIPNTKGITVIGGIGGTTILTNIGFSLSQ